MSALLTEKFKSKEHSGQKGGFVRLPAEIPAPRARDSLRFWRWTGQWDRPGGKTEIFMKHPV